MRRLPKNYGSHKFLDPYEPIWAHAHMGNFSKIDKLDCQVPAQCFPYQYVYYVIDQIYSNQDAPANKLIYTSLGRSHSQAISRSANK